MFLDRIAQPVEPALAHDELQPGCVLVLAVAVDIEYADHRFHAPDDVFGGNELVQNLGFGRQRPQASGDGHSEAALAVADQWPQADIVDGRGHAILGAAAEGDLELARKIVGQLPVQKRKGQTPRVGLDFENFLRMQTRKRARGDVADGVITRFARGQTDIGEQMQ